MGKGIMVIGAAILDVLARPVSMQVFKKGSHPVQELRLEVEAMLQMKPLCLLAWERMCGCRQCWEMIWQAEWSWKA